MKVRLTWCEYGIMSILLALGFTSCHAQQRHEVPPVQKIGWQCSDDSSTICYEFPPEAIQELNEILKAQRSAEYYLILSREGADCSIRVYPMATDASATGNREAILKASHRRTVINGSFYPVLLDYDYMFSMPGFTVTHYMGLVRFKAP